MNNKRDCSFVAEIRSTEKLVKINLYRLKLEEEQKPKRGFVAFTSLSDQRGKKKDML